MHYSGTENVSVEMMQELMEQRLKLSAIMYVEVIPMRCVVDSGGCPSMSMMVGRIITISVSNLYIGIGFGQNQENRIQVLSTIILLLFLNCNITLPHNRKQYTVCHRDRLLLFYYSLHYA